jgi:hypothetical protein
MLGTSGQTVRPSSSDEHVNCHYSEGGKHALHWDFVYLHPIKVYGQYEGGGRHLSTVHCVNCGYKGPYYPRWHETLMNEPYKPEP